MTEFGAADDPVSKAVLEFIESIRNGKAGAGLGSERVLHAEGKSAAEAARTLEAYRTRILMRQFDKNGDGKIERGEMPEQFRPLFDRLATFRLPSNAPHQTLKSVEPVNGGRGAFGRSYFTVQAGDDKDEDTSIWLFGFSPDGQHVIRRLDDGAQTGKPARRLDPESYIGDRE
jgi:hypothetical protein